MNQILIVDDDPEMRRGLAEAVRLEGYRVFEADSGPAALQLLMSNKPDLVITDYEMPGMNGLELLETMRSRGGYEDIPAIVCSASDRGERNFRGCPPARAFFIGKPFDVGELLDMITAHLEKSRENLYPRVRTFSDVYVKKISQIIGYGECREVRAEEFAPVAEIPDHDDFAASLENGHIEMDGLRYKYYDSVKEHYVENGMHYVVFYVRYLLDSERENFLTFLETAAPEDILLGGKGTE